MALVDGDAARALGDLVRERWRRATGETLAPPLATDGDAWPAAIKPDMADVISRSRAPSRPGPGGRGRRVAGR